MKENARDNQEEQEKKENYSTAAAAATESKFDGCTPHIHMNDTQKSTKTTKRRIRRTKNKRAEIKQILLWIYYKATNLSWFFCSAAFNFVFSFRLSLIHSLKACICRLSRPKSPIHHKIINRLLCVAVYTYIVYRTATKKNDSNKTKQGNNKTQLYT